MVAGSRSRIQYTMLSVQFENDLSRNTNRDWRLLNMFAKFVFIDQCGFLRRCKRLVMVCEQDGHGARVPLNDFSFGWKYTANKSVNKRCTEEHVDR